MLATCLTPAALTREAERLRHMARRARNCMDVTPMGVSHERYAARLEALAADLLARRAGVMSH